MKEFFKSSKSTAILGLVGSVIMLVFMSIYNISYPIAYCYDLYFIGLIIYFIIILTRLFKQKGNVKIANCILVATFVISIISGIILAIYEAEALFTLNDLLLIIMTFYFINILFIKKKLINNKVFAITILGISIYEIVRGCMLIADVGGIEVLDMSYLIRYIANIMIIPYFYNYYELLKGGK